MIGGLDYYLKAGSSVRGSAGLKQAALVGALAKVKYHPAAIAWAVDTKTLKASYFSKDSCEEFAFDPKSCIVGVFLQ